MKIFIQTETQTADAVSEPRPRQAILETAAGAPAVQAALEAIAARLGAITAVPAAPHEANLKLVLPRDLAEQGIAPLPCRGPAAEAAGTAPGTGEMKGAEGHAVLKILRSPGEGEVTNLRYEVLVTPG
jgi:hypothetical protein